MTEIRIVGEAQVVAHAEGHHLICNAAAPWKLYVVGSDGSRTLLEEGQGPTQSYNLPYNLNEGEQFEVETAQV